MCSVLDGVRCNLKSWRSAHPAGCIRDRGPLQARGPNVPAGGAPKGNRPPSPPVLPSRPLLPSPLPPPCQNRSAIVPQQLQTFIGPSILAHDIRLSWVGTTALLSSVTRSFTQHRGHDRIVSAKVNPSIISKIVTTRYNGRPCCRCPQQDCRWKRRLPQLQQ